MAWHRLKRRKGTEIPTSSMADIAFLLIIFFMLTAVFTSSRGIQWQMPKDDPDDLNVQPEEAIHIRIIGEGQFVVDKVTRSYDEMGGYIQAKMEQNSEKPVIIQTEADVPYYVMIDVFDQLKYLEVKNVSIPTKSDVERWRRLGVF
jgi:biopolymer transport protein ExbD